MQHVYVGPGGMNIGQRGALISASEKISRIDEQLHKLLHNKIGRCESLKLKV
jgi:hypothetical protein